MFSLGLVDMALGTNVHQVNTVTKNKILIPAFLGGFSHCTGHCQVQYLQLLTKIGRQISD